MNRRDAIRQTALIMGYAVSASAASAVLAGCEVEQGDGWKPSFLNPEEAKLVAEIAERIVPRTTTPGAKDVYVDRFIDTMLANFMKEKEVSIFKEGLKDIDARSQSSHNDSFVSIPDKDKDAILTTLAAEAKASMKGKDPKAPKPFFSEIRSLSYLGYFSSEKVGKEVLAYDPVPGGYQNCIPLEQNGGVNWAI